MTDDILFVLQWLLLAALAVTIAWPILRILLDRWHTHQFLKDVEKLPRARR